jgi:hypothetical protein
MLKDRNLGPLSTLDCHRCRHDQVYLGSASATATPQRKHASGNSAAVCIAVSPNAPEAIVEEGLGDAQDYVGLLGRRQYVGLHGGCQVRTTPSAGAG